MSDCYISNCVLVAKYLGIRWIFYSLSIKYNKDIQDIKLDYYHNYIQVIIIEEIIIIIIIVKEGIDVSQYYIS